mmetsp:Transcript_24894/g.45106  ORF Transcript_24894/g.45106 Transcript_24894/m.45106 type:complete len:213 (+) Transcript_24894:2855-3493(+)
MAKWVNLPSTSRYGCFPKVLHQELMSPGCLINHGTIIWRCLVMHAPSAIDEFHLATRNDFSHLVSFPLWLLTPPACKESNLYINELPVWVFKQASKHGVDDVVNISVEVLIHGHLPASVVMSVRDQMHVDLSLNWPTRSIVLPSLRWHVTRKFGALPNWLISPVWNRRFVTNTSSLSNALFVPLGSNRSAAKHQQQQLHVQLFSKIYSDCQK